MSWDTWNNGPNLLCPKHNDSEKHNIKKETHKLSLELKGNNKYYKKNYYTLSKTILNNLKQLCDDADSFCIAMHCLFSGNLKKK